MGIRVMLEQCGMKEQSLVFYEEAIRSSCCTPDARGDVLQLQSERRLLSEVAARTAMKTWL